MCTCQPTKSLRHNMRVHSNYSVFCLTVSNRVQFDLTYNPTAWHGILHMNSNSGVIVPLSIFSSILYFIARKLQYNIYGSLLCYLFCCLTEYVFFNTFTFKLYYFVTQMTLWSLHYVKFINVYIYEVYIFHLLWCHQFTSCPDTCDWHLLSNMGPTGPVWT